MSLSDLLKNVRQEYDRFAQTSLLIPPSVVELFKSRFSGEQCRDIAVPEETNGQHAIAMHDETTNGRESEDAHSTASENEAAAAP